MIISLSDNVTMSLSSVVSPFFHFMCMASVNESNCDLVRLGKVISSPNTSLLAVLSFILNPKLHQIKKFSYVYIDFLQQNSTLCTYIVGLRANQTPLLMLKYNHKYFMPKATILPTKLDGSKKRWLLNKIKLTWENTVFHCKEW